ncbi:unnamed protein product [Pieris macdunnoughi]|uniref:Uncharacterized protein n=1 Tax=Pieris macdunnoughi TaxID=345717 RepID=A0A821QRA0_9NEOP|nr:unnamed protein product [Pieris macdunnoughi]
MYSDQCSDVLFENVDLKKRGSTDMTGIKLDPLYPDGQSISCEKKKDLLDLLPFIPPVYHSFYTSIKDNAAVRNVIDVEDDIDND